MSYWTIVRDSMLPNRAWLGRMNSPANKPSRLKYLAFRLVLAVVVLAILFLYNVHQHPQLR